MFKRSLLLALGLLGLGNANRLNIAVGDFNGDGNQDFIRQKTGGWAQNSADIYLSTGRGTFRKQALEGFLLNGEYTNLFVGDFNGDGRDDLLRQEKGSWADDGSNTANLLLSNGKGDFTKIVLDEDFVLDGRYTNLFIGDFNGDGKADVFRQEKSVLANNNRDTAHVLLSTGNNFRKFALPENFDLHGDYVNLFVGDFNGDGKDDLFRQEKNGWANDNSGTAKLLISNGRGEFTRVDLPESLTLNGDYTTLSIGDFNGDGAADVLRREKGGWASDRSGSADLLISDRNGGFRKIGLDEGLEIKDTNVNAYVGDFNGDGKDDFIRQEKGDFTRDNSRTVEVMISTGEGFRAVDYPHDGEMSGDVSLLLVGDFNGDEKPDFIQYSGADSINIHYNQGDATFF